MVLVKGLNPGRLSKRVTICRYTETEDELGSTAVTLRPLRTVWAEIRPLRGSEQLEYYKIRNKETYKVTMRHTDVTEKDVLAYKGKRFHIEYITDPLEAGYYLELYVTEDIDRQAREEGL